MRPTRGAEPSAAGLSMDEDNDSGFISDCNILAGVPIGFARSIAHKYYFVCCSIHSGHGLVNGWVVASHGIAVVIIIMGLIPPARECVSITMTTRSCRSSGSSIRPGTGGLCQSTSSSIGLL